MPDPGASHAYTRLGRFALIVTTLLWGSSFTIMKDALATVPALWLLAIRFSGAAMLMALIGIRSLRRLDRGYLTGGACMGVCLYLAYTLQTYAHHAGEKRLSHGDVLRVRAVFLVADP